MNLINKNNSLKFTFIKTLFIPAFTFNNLHAFNYSQTMSKHYKVKDYVVEKFLSPVLMDKSILKIRTYYTKKAPYLHIHTIFVKENFHNLGLYNWNNRFHSYINILDNKPLILKPKTIYLISKINFTNKNDDIPDLRNFTTKKLKNYLIHSKFLYHSISYKNFLFYRNIIRKLINDRLIYLKNKEFIFLVDRGIQKAFIFNYNKKYNNISYIGSSKVSTGNPRLNSRNDRYFQTPIMIINRKKYLRGDWKTDKTNFQEYGAKNNRIFYLGKHNIPIDDNSHIFREVHLAIHSTNPIDTKLLGHKASRGCIRISSNLDKILNKSGIIDGKKGKYVIVIDSSLKLKDNIKLIKKFR
ncbi:MULTISPECIES: L,D-transpeptidase [unclassified Lebetimonas]|uniref:L,D-transpeptidase n=1 Tax=unclassified Lebetimonas TaxID=2648158 RepID=UPI000464FA2F|nr:MULTISPECIES: L,D-transpeptidase [unclassified Lebetimonas]